MFFFHNNSVVMAFREKNIAAYVRTSFSTPPLLSFCPSSVARGVRYSFVSFRFDFFFIRRTRSRRYLQYIRWRPANYFDSLSFVIPWTTVRPDVVTSRARTIRKRRRSRACETVFVVVRNLSNARRRQLRRKTIFHSFFAYPLSAIEIWPKRIRWRFQFFFV